MVKLGPRTVGEFLADTNELEKLVLSETPLAPGKMSSKKPPSQTFIEYLRLQQQNYAEPDNKPVAQAYKMVADNAAANPELMKLPGMQNLKLRKGLLDYSNSTAPMKEKLIAKLREIFGKTAKSSKGDEKEEKGASGFPSVLAVSTGKVLRKTWEKNQIGKLDQKKGGDRYKIENTYTTAAQIFLANQKLSLKQITSFLRLVDNESPEIPYLLTFIKKDLVSNGTKFGTYKMHKKLTLKEMDLLGKKTKELAGSSPFWETYCWKLQLINDKDYIMDLKARGQYLSKLKRLLTDQPNTKKCSGLRAIILFNYMKHMELTQGKYDKACLMNYLAIPRERGYNSTVLKNLLKKRPLCPYDYSIPDIPCLFPIEDDEPFVTRALADLFRSKTEAYPKWVELVDTKWVKILFTRTKLMSRQGNQGDLKSQLLADTNKYEYAKLKEKVEITFCPNNKCTFQVDERVELDVWVKNVDELRIDTYELNALEYYTKNGKEISLDLRLDGLAPTDSCLLKTMQGDSIVKARHTLQLNAVKNQSGIYLVELVGNGQRTRCVIRKGELRYVAKRIDVPGKGRCTDIVVLEKNMPVKSPRVWVGSKVYDADERGHVICDYNQDGNGVSPFVVECQSKPGSATLHFMEFPSSSYSLRCGLYIDRESLLARQTAKCIVRPALFVDEEPCSISNLKNCKLIITCVTIAESTTKVITPHLSDEREYVYELTVPNELRTVVMKLQGSVQKQGKGPMIKLENVESFTVNLIDNEDYLGDLHLIPKGAAGYVIAAFGKTGEPYRDQVVKIKLEHRYLQRAIEHELATNVEGLIYLGRLPDVQRISAISKTGTMYPNEYSWELLQDKVNVPSVVNVNEKDVVRIPFMTAQSKGPKMDVYDTKYVRKFKTVNYVNGYVEIQNLPVGDFIAHLKDSQSIDVKISVGSGTKIQAGGVDFVVSNSRVVELSKDMPLQITTVTGGRDQGYDVQVQGWNGKTRVHILSTYLVPKYTSFSALASPMMKPNVNDLLEVWNEYGTQMDLAEEFVYVNARRLNLVKRGEEKLGVQLPCPSVIQTPVTFDNTVVPKLRDNVSSAPDAEPKTRQRGRYERVAEAVLGTDVRTTVDSCNLEWLSEPSVVAENLVPDDAGWIHIPNINVTNSKNLLQIIATDENNISLRNVILPAPKEEEKLTDCRLLNGLDPNNHLAEIREILFKQPGESMLVPNWETTQFETVDDISDVFELFLTIAAKKSERMRASLAGFYPMTIWNELPHESRLKFYGSRKCNELNFWLYRKDPEFFQRVVKPFLAGKVQKDVMDHFLLGNIQALETYTGSRWGTLNVLERILVDSVVIREGTQERFNDLVAESMSRACTISQMEELFRLTVESKHMARMRQSDLLADLADDAKKEAQGKFNLTVVLEEARYYDVPFEKTNANLMVANDFWRDFAIHMFNSVEGPFLSKNYGYACNNLTEMLSALACLDLDYRVNVEALEPVKVYPNGSSTYIMEQPVKIAFRTPSIVLCKQLKVCTWDQSALSVSTNYFDPLASATVVDGELEDSFLDATKLHSQKVYGCRVVVTNVSSQKYEVEVLTQIPVGSIPVRKGHKTRNQIVSLDPFQTTVVPYYFYFPFAGNFTHWPAHVNMNGKILGFDMEYQPICVVDPRKIKDTSSWSYMCRSANFGDLLQFLQYDPELSERDLSLLGPRGSKNIKEFKEICETLRNRFLYSPVLWKNSLKHGPNAREEIEEYLNMSWDFQAMLYPCFGDALRGDAKRPLGSYDSLIRKHASYNEFWTATGVAGKNSKYSTNRPEVANLDKTYHNFLLTAMFSSHHLYSMSVGDRLCATYYMILQNRIEDAIKIFHSIKEPLIDNQLYDYMKGFLVVHSDASGLMDLSALTAKYLKSDNIGPSLRSKWEALDSLIGELSNTAAYNSDFVYETEEERMERSERVFNLKHEDGRYSIEYKNFGKITVKMYKISIELMFSTSPFTNSSLTYRYVEPTKCFAKEVEMEAKVNVIQLSDIIGEMDSESRDSYIFEAISEDRCLNGALYFNTFEVQLSETQVRILRKRTRSPIVKAYVKVYAQTTNYPDGVFYKDGYTDLRGRFDYKTVPTRALENVSKLAILVKTISNGAAILHVQNN